MNANIHESLGSTLLNRVLMSGPEDLVHKAIAESQDENSCFDFNKVLPRRPFLEPNIEAASPYNDYLARYCLKYQLVNKAFSLNAMLEFEKPLLVHFPDLKADEYVRGKAYFSNNYRDVTISNFNIFYQRGKCFSKLAAYWNLLERLCHYSNPFDLLRLLAVPAEEEAYQKKEGRNFTRAEWEASKDVFLQLIDPSSQLFSEYLKGLWGVDNGPSNSKFSYSHDGSALLTFNTTGGVPDKVIAALAEKNPSLKMTHYWEDTDHPEKCGCTIYNMGGRIAV